MIITKTKKIEFEYLKEGISTCNEGIHILWGSSSAITDIRYKGIKRLERGKWIIPYNLFYERFSFMKEKVKRVNSAYEAMLDIKKDIKKVNKNGKTKNEV